jgi:hypothetical protein
MDATVAVYWPEYRVFSDARGRQPGVKTSYGTPPVATIRNAYVVALAVLVGFGTPQVEHDTMSDVLNIGDIERDQFGPP